MATGKKKTTPEIPLRNITISLVGGSGAGKTSFFKGIIQSLLGDGIRLPGDKKIDLLPVRLYRGIEVNPGEIQETPISQVDESTIDSQDVNDAISQLMAFPGTEVSAAPALNRDTQNFAEFDVDAAEGDDAKLAERARLADAINKAFEINDRSGFRGSTATTRFVCLKFHVRLNSESKCTLTITDYAGELIDNASTTSESGVRTLSKYLNQSDAAIILASARSLSEHIKESYTSDETMFKKQLTKDSVSADNINNIFKSLSKHKNFTMVLAITQKDSPQVDERLSRNNFQRTQLEMKEHIFAPAFDAAKYQNWSYGVIPITVIGTKSNGEPNVDANNKLLPGAEIQQENTDIAVLFCLYNAIMGQIASLQQTIAPLDKKFLKAIFQSAEEKAQLKILEGQLDSLQQLRKAMAEDTSLFEPIGLRHSAMEVVNEVNTVKVKESAGSVC